MAVREISTKLVMQGEKEYKSAIAQINREYKALESGLKLIESQFKGQQNTLAALEAKHKALADVIAKQTEKYKTENAAIKQNQEYQKKAAEQAEAVRRQIEELNRSTSDADKQTEEYQKQLKQLEAALKASESAEANAAANIDRHTAAANNAQIKLNTLNAALRENDKYLEEAKASSDGCAKSIDSMGNAVKDSERRFLELGEKGSQSIDALASALAAAGVAGTLKEIAQGIRACLDSSIEFESAMAGVAKTTDLSGEELAGMSQKIQELSERIPLTTTELAQIAEAGGQLGIANEDLMAFTETMAALGVSTNMTSEEAAVMVAQFATITGMEPSMYANLGSAIVDLGNNFATNEKKITEMSLAMTAGGKNARMSAPDILALSTAVTSLGIEATVGGNNMTELIGDMQLAVETGKDLDLWAKAAGMSAQEFAALWGTDATQAIVRFITALGTTEESARATLVALGQNDDRLVRMVTSLNAAEKETGLLTRALQASESAWIANTALMKEAETRYATTESKQQILTNSINNLKIAVGDQLKPAMNELLDVGTDWTQWATDFVESNKQIVPVMTAVVAALSTLVGGIAGLNTVIKTVIPALKTLNETMHANPWVLAASAIAAVAVAIGTLVITSQGANEEVQALATAQENLNTAMEGAETAYNASVAEIEAQSSVVGNLCDRLDELAGKSELTADEQTEQARIVTQLNTLLPGLNASIDAQTGVLNTSTEAIRQQTEAWKEQQIALAVAQAQQEVMQAYSAAMIELTKVEIARGEKLKELEIFEKNQAGALERLAEATGETSEDLREMSHDQRVLAIDLAIAEERIDDQAEALEKESKYVKDAEASIASLRSEVVALDDAYESASRTVEEAETELKTLKQVQQNLIGTSAKVPGAAGAVANAIETVTGSLKPAEQAYEEYNAVMESMAQKQKEMAESIKSGFDSVVGAFDEIVPGMAANADEIRQNLDSQLAYWDNYGSLLEWAIENDINPKMLEALNDGSKESVAILQMMRDGGEEAIREFSEKFDLIDEKRGKVAEMLAAELVDAENGFNELAMTVAEGVEKVNQSNEAYAAASATARAVADGLRSQLSAIRSAAAEITSAASIGSVGSLSGKVQASKGGGFSSHAHGIEYVPYDGYLAELHEGERVQTAMEARAQRALDMTNYGAMRRFERMMEAAGSTTNSNVTVNIYANGSSRSELRKAADEVAMRLRYKGVIV